MPQAKLSFSSAKTQRTPGKNRLAFGSFFRTQVNSGRNRSAPPRFAFTTGERRDNDILGIERLSEPKQDFFPRRFDLGDGPLAEPRKNVSF